MNPIRRTIKDLDDVYLSTPLLYSRLREHPDLHPNLADLKIQSIQKSEIIGFYERVITEIAGRLDVTSAEAQMFEARLKVIEDRADDYRKSYQAEFQERVKAERDLATIIRIVIENDQARRERDARN